MTDPNNIIQEQLGEFQEMSNDLRKNADAIKVTSGEENNKEDYSVALEVRKSDENFVMLKSDVAATCVGCIFCML